MGCQFIQSIPFVPRSRRLGISLKSRTMGKLQHSVPRFYLRAWADREKIYCLQDNEIRNPNIKGVGAENYFYRLQELSPEDVDFLREAIIKDSPEGLKASHEQLVDAFVVPYLAKRNSSH
jgi:hypothetical protein